MSRLQLISSPYAGRSIISSGQECSLAVEKIGKIVAKVLTAGYKILLTLERFMTRIRLELAGQDFWSWHVESFAGMSARGHTLWNCTCECGYEQAIEGSRLKNGYTKSCGCKVAEAFQN